MGSAPGRASPTILANRFRLVRHIGAGGMGDVYEAEDLQLHDRVALKTIRTEVACFPGITDRFRREIFLSKKVTHPNICRIHDLGVHRSEDGSETLFLTMELLIGESLTDLIRRGAIPVREAFPIIEQLCNALAAAHKEGIIHRDFKSSNVLLVNVSPRIRAIVTDFGLAQPFQSRHHDPSLTPANAILGTPAYMSPEQAKGEILTPSSDIYALGVVMYEMATGQRPFKADSDVGLALKHISEEPVPPSALAPQCDRHWENVILRCLKKRPEERFSSANAVKDALLVDTVAAPPVALKRTVFVRWGLATGIAAVLLSLAVVVIEWRAIASRFYGLPLHKRVAVLEFENVGGDPANAAFCEGLLQSFTSELTRLEQNQPTLSVVPAADVRSEHIQSVREANREFNANVVITGSVQRSADGLHLIVNLVNADELKQIRSESIFVPENNPVAMEEGVIKQVADLLDVEFTQGARRQLAQGNPNNPGAYEFYLQGMGYLLMGRATDEAISEFQRALQLDANYALARAGLGIAFWRKYESTKDSSWVNRAWKEARKAATLNPQLAPVHTTLAILNAGTGNHEEAIRQAEWAIKLDPSQYEGYAQLAASLEASGEIRKAETALKRAIAIRPEYWRNYVRLGTFYFNHGRYAEAEKAYDRVTELVPDNPTGYTDLGVIFHLENHDLKAEQMLKKSLQLRPTAQAYSNLATVYFFSHQYSAAVPIMEKLLESGSTDSLMWGNLGDAYRWTPGKEYKSVAAYRKAIELAKQSLGVNPKDSDALTGLALYEAKTGQTDAALAAIKSALTLAPHDSNVLFNAAIVFELAGKREMALNYLKLAAQSGYSLNEMRESPN